MNESCHTHEWKPTHTNGYCHTYKWATFHIYVIIYLFLPCLGQAKIGRKWHPTWLCKKIAGTLYLLNVAVCCSVLQCVAVCCSVLQWGTKLASNGIKEENRRYSVPPEFCCSVLQCVAVCCSVLQCLVVKTGNVTYGKSFSSYEF